MSSNGVSAAPLTSVFDDVQGLSIHARVSARMLNDPAAPIVFVHGLGVSVRYLEPTMIRLAPDYAVAGLDLPGFGRSTTPPAALDVRGLCDALIAWLDVRRTAPALFVGNSYGCQVIVELAVREPSRVRGLVLNAPTMDPAHRTVFGQLIRIIADIPYEPWTLALIVARDYLRVGPARLLATLRHALADRIEDKVPRVVAPTLIVCGARDPVVTVPWASRVSRLTGTSAAGASGATLSVLPSGAHALPYDDPAAFASLVRSFHDRLLTVSHAR